MCTRGRSSVSLRSIAPVKRRRLVDGEQVSDRIEELKPRGNPGHNNSVGIEFDGKDRKLSGEATTLL